MPTFERPRRFVRDYQSLTPAQAARFMAVLRDEFIPAIGQLPPYPPGLRIKRVIGTIGIWEMTWDGDGRATFSFGEQVIAGETHIVWRRVGTHAILIDP